MEEGRAEDPAQAPEEKTPAQEVKRPWGCPKGGRVVFTDAQIAALPVKGTAAEMARALGVRPSTVRWWCSMGCPFEKPKGRYVLRAKALKEWLWLRLQYDTEMADGTDDENSLRGGRGGDPGPAPDDSGG